MKIKAIILTGVLALSLLCACGANDNTSDISSDTEAAILEDSTTLGNFSDPVFIENPGTDTVIVEMP